MYRVSYPLQILMKLGFSQHIFEKLTNIKRLEYRSSDTRVVPCEYTDRQTDTAKLVVTFRYFAKKKIKPKNEYRNFMNVIFK